MNPLIPQVPSLPQDDPLKEQLRQLPQDAGVQPLQFHAVNQYTTFRAEYAREDDDLVFHFFLPAEMDPGLRSTATYWLHVFPQQLEPVLYGVFRVQPPRLQAQYISDCGLNSWWVRAYGFGAELDPDGFARLLFKQLDAALDARNQK